MPIWRTIARMPRLRSMRRSAHCRTSSFRAGTSGTVTRVLLASDVLVDHLRGHRRLTAGPDELHVSAGVGVKLGAVEVDAAADLSERIDTFSLSTVVRF